MVHNHSNYCFISLQAIENGRNLVALSCSIKLVNAIVSVEKRETPITDVKTNQLLIIKGFTHYVFNFTEGPIEG